MGCGAGSIPGAGGIFRPVYWINANPASREIWIAIICSVIPVLKVNKGWGTRRADHKLSLNWLVDHTPLSEYK